MTRPLRVFSPDYQSPEPGCAEPTGFVVHVRGVVDLYIEHLRARNRAGELCDDGLAGAVFELRRFVSFFGHFLITDCRQHDLTRFFAMNPQLRAVETKKRIVTTLIACFQWAEDEELIQRCPYRRPKALKRQKRKVRRAAEAWEYVTLMRFGSRPLRQALFGLRRTGMRTKEMRVVLWSDIDLGAAPHIRVATGKGARKIGLDPATANWFRALKRNQRGMSDRPFTNCAGTSWDRHTFARHLRRYAERLGIDDGVSERVSAYCVRHTYVCDGIEGGVTTRRIADQVGHARTDMIDMVYGSHTRERIEHLGDVAQEILRKRKRRKSPKPARPQRDGFQQESLFPEES